MLLIGFNLLGIIQQPYCIFKALTYLSSLPIASPPLKPEPKPPWKHSKQNDTSQVDIASCFITIFMFTRLVAQTDPFWATKASLTPQIRVLPRPPPAPDPDILNTPYACPLKYEVSNHADHDALHRLQHLHLLEQRHFRLLAINNRLPHKLPIHLLMKFCPQVPNPDLTLKTDEGEHIPWTTPWQLQHWETPKTILQVHPTIAKAIKATTIQHLTHSFKSAVGFNVTDTFNDELAMDVDSKPFGIDPMASATISNCKDEFIDIKPLPKTYLEGVGGRVPVEGIGTLMWPIEDDLGMIHQIKVTGAYYCSQAPLRLLCPQQWATQREKELGPEHNTSFTTQAHFSRLQWGQYRLTVPHDDKTNLPLWRTAPSYHKVVMNTQVSQVNQNTPTLTPEPAIVSDDEESVQSETNQPNLHEESNEARPSDNPREVNFPFDNDHEARAIPPTCQPTNDSLTDHQSELLKLHYKYGHVSFKFLKYMAQQGLIPRRLAHCEAPRCSSCLYGKQTKRPWRSKAKPTRIGGRKPSKPGECVSVDHMISKTPGLIAQVKGWLTRRRYHAATVFADHASSLTYVHVSEGSTADETLEAKAAFEAFALDLGVTIKHYHADNGRFAETAFMEQVKASGQTITFCGVGAHHQNGVAERRIRDLTEHARTMLLHASHRWPKAINVHLWPYALRQAAHIRNHVPRESEGGIPIQVFSGSNVHNRVFCKHQHTFGCPCYVLETPLQSGIGKPKWSERSRVGAYLGHSSNHSQSVALVLNLKTGHVSPQFHIVFDDDFATVNHDYASQSMWQELSELEQNRSEEVLVDPDINNNLKDHWNRRPQPTVRPQTAPAVQRHDNNNNNNTAEPVALPAQ